DGQYRRAPDQGHDQQAVWAPTIGPRSEDWHRQGRGDGGQRNRQARGYFCREPIGSLHVLQIDRQQVDRRRGTELRSELQDQQSAEPWPREGSEPAPPDAGWVVY